MIAVVFNPQSSGGRIEHFEDIETLMRKKKLNRVSDETRAVVAKAERRGQIIYATHNPYQSEMSAGEGEPVHELMVDLDKTRLIDTFYQLRAEV